MYTRSALPNIQRHVQTKLGLAFSDMISVVILIGVRAEGIWNREAEIRHRPKSEMASKWHEGMGVRQKVPRLELSGCCLGLRANGKSKATNGGAPSVLGFSGPQYIGAREGERVYTHAHTEFSQ